MNVHNHRSPQYQYTHSFNNFYHENQPKAQLTSVSQQQHTQNSHLTLQYETTSTPHHFSTIQDHSPRKLDNQNLTYGKQFTLENHLKRLHSSHRKYSFSVFVKQSKKKIQSTKKSPSKSLSSVKSSIQKQKDFNLIRRLNNQAIKTFYQSFINDPKNGVKKVSNQQSHRNSNSRILSQRQIRTKKVIPKGDMNQSSKLFSRDSIIDDDGQKTDCPKHFFNTISYGQKFLSNQTSIDNKINTSRQRKLLNAKQSPQKYIFVQRSVYQQIPQNKNTFLKIQKCALEKKDQNFIKDCYDFKEILLKKQQKREAEKKKAQRQAQLLNLLNKNKRSQKFFQALHLGKDHRHVSEMRDMNKRKKTIKSQVKVQYECPVNDIEPW